MVVGPTLDVYVGTQLWRDPQGFEHDFRYWSKNQWNCVAVCPVIVGFWFCIELFVCIHVSPPVRAAEIHMLWKTK